MEAQSPVIDMYQKDIEELEKLINVALRPNIKRQLEEYKNNLSNLLYTGIITLTFSIFLLFPSKYYPVKDHSKEC